MLPRTFGALLSLVGAAALLTAATAAEAGDGRRAPDPRWASIVLVDGGGYRFVSPGHDNRLTITRDGNRVRFHDRASRRWGVLPAECRRVTVRRGIAATCAIPPGTSPAAPLLLQIRTRAGDDRVNGSTLGAELQVDARGADGDDVLRSGAADDQLSGAAGNDTLLGGAGSDLFLCGPGTDTTDDDGLDDGVTQCELVV